MAHASIRYRQLEIVAEAAREALDLYDEAETCGGAPVLDEAMERLRDELEKC